MQLAGHTSTVPEKPPPAHRDASISTDAPYMERRTNCRDAGATPPPSSGRFEVWTAKPRITWTPGSIRCSLDAVKILELPDYRGLQMKEGLASLSAGEMIWIAIGLCGQVCFFSRFLVQWVVSERKGESVIPLAFWYFSIVGGLILLAYAIYRRDPVFILGQSTGCFIYIRNLVLISRSRTRNCDAVDA